MKNIVEYLLFESSSEAQSGLRKLADSDMGVNTNGVKDYGNLSGIASYFKRQLISLYCDKIEKSDFHKLDVVVNGKEEKATPQWAAKLSEKPTLFAIYIDGANKDALEEVSNIVINHEVCDEPMEDLRVVVISENDKVENLLSKEAVEKLKILNLSPRK